MRITSHAGTILNLMSYFTKRLKAPEAFDQDYRTEVYKEWQKLFSEDLPALILYAQNSIWAYNERIQDIKSSTYYVSRFSYLVG